MNAKKFKEFKKMERVTHGAEQTFYTLFETSDILVSYQELEPGYRAENDRHGCDEVIFRIEGETTQYFNGEEILVKPRTTLEIPAYSEHSFEVSNGQKVKQLVFMVKNQIYGDFFD